MGCVSQESAASFNVTEDKAGTRDQASNLCTGILGGMSWG